MSATVSTVDKSQRRVREMFGEIAGRYDLLNHVLSLNIDRYWRWRTVRAVPAEGSAPILDLCTGTGDLALAYCRDSTAATVVGADFCGPMLALGREKSSRAGVSDRLTFVEADAMQLPFGEDLFQIVCVAFGLRNIADTDRGLTEMVRVCRPGGKVAVLEFSQPRWQLLAAVYGWYFQRVLPRIGQTIARNRHGAYQYLPRSVSEFPSGEQLVRRMTAAGLHDVWFRPLTFGVATLYVGQK